MVTLSTYANSSSFDPIPLSEYSCDFGGQTVKWYDTSTWFNLGAINNTLAERGCKYARRKIRDSYVDDVEKLNSFPIPDPNSIYSGGIIGCPTRTNVPMTIVGAHAPTKDGSFIDTYKISRNTPYELHQKDQSKRGTNRLDKWYSQWHIESGFESHADIYGHVYTNFINGRRNGHSNTGAMTFSNYGFLNPNINSTKKYQVISNMTRGTREYSISINGTFNGSFSGVDFDMKLPSAKINGERCYSTTMYNLMVEHNTKPTIHSITKSSNNLTASATDKHTADSYLSYTWEVTDENNRKHYKTGKTISLSGISGNYYSAIVTVSDGDMSSSLKKTFESAPPKPIDVRPCPTCEIP